MRTIFNVAQFLMATIVLADGLSFAPKSTLYDVPVSNNGARCRIIIYKKSIEEEVKIESPGKLGGLKDPEYLKLNPQGKMPLLVVDDPPLAIPESDTICRYLLSTYSSGPSFQPDNASSNLVARLHDMYLTTIQGCLYKAQPPFGIFNTRSDAIAEFRKQLQIIDDVLPSNNDGPYLFGTEVSLADATLFPTMVFAKFMLPKFLNVAENDEVLPSKINSWFNNVVEKDGVFDKVRDEVLGSLEGWNSKGRWDTILGAGVKDDGEFKTIFDKIVSKEIPSEVVRETDKLLAFKDINPAGPAHILVIPKERMGLLRLTEATLDHKEILGDMLLMAGEIARDESLGFVPGNARIVINNGPDGGQEVDHLHIHVIGGRQMKWPPG